MRNIQLCIMWSCSLNWDKKKPYSSEYRNEKYGLFAEVAARQGIDVFLVQISWYKGMGSFKQGWFFDPDIKAWTKVGEIAADVVYDKSSPRKLEKKKQVAKTVPVVNHWKIEVICKDKLETYRLFKKFVPKTIRITNKASLLRALDLLPGEMVVLKPIGGSRGAGVMVVRKELVRQGKVKLEKKTDYIAQQFIMSARGIPSLGIKGRHDLRVFVANGKPVLSYVRVAKRGTFVANLALGGASVHLPRNNIPKDVMRIVKAVDKWFSGFGTRIYSTDFSFDDTGKAWLLELNSHPGFVYPDEQVPLGAQVAFYRAVARVLKRVARPLPFVGISRWFGAGVPAKRVSLRAVPR